MKLRLGDRVWCSHHLLVCPEDWEQKFIDNFRLYMLTGALPPMTDGFSFLLDCPEKLCPVCGKEWKIGDEI